VISLRKHVGSAPAIAVVKTLHRPAGRGLLIGR